MEEPEPPRRERTLRWWLRSWRFPLSILILGVGAFLSALALGDFTPLANGPPFTAINAATDQSAKGGVNYNLAFVIVGPIVTIVGLYFVGAYLLARRRFEHLMQTKSKAEFLRNIPELEGLLWDLTPRDEDRYGDKRAELRLRR